MSCDVVMVPISCKTSQSKSANLLEMDDEVICFLFHVVFRIYIGDCRTTHLNTKLFASSGLEVSSRLPLEKD